MGDMLKIIKKCQFDVGKLKDNNRFVTGLLNAFRKRSELLFESKAFKAALLFDHRRSFMDSPFFSKEDKLVAIVSFYNN